MPTDMNVSEASAAAAASKSNTKQKERHIVTWTQQEDDILREQIGIHGTENWAIIAAKFKDKTTRQCRRRWYTYLNSDFKKGGWSPEEDMILCEAQRIFGNRWTEIAKVVSGRTDNAVKNRFSTLCKKRAKHDALSKENTSCISSNHKRSSVVITNGTSDSAPPLKKLRTHISEIPLNNNLEGRLHREIVAKGTEELRHPFAVLGQNSHNVGGLSAQLHFNNTSTASNEVGNNKVQGTFIRRDDPKITSLMRQAELLTTLAAKVNTENTNQSLENAWKELQTFLNRAGEGELLKYRSPDDFPFGDFKELVEDLKSSNIGTMPSWRQPGLYESPGSSEYSTGSTLQSHASGEKTEQLQAEVCSLNQDGTVFPQPTMFSENDDVVCEDGFSGTTVIGVGAQSTQTEVGNGGDGYVDGFCCSTSVAQVINLSSSNEAKENVVTSALPHTEFSSPIQVTPLFQTFAAGIPTPKFTESERHFLMKTLGMTSPSPKPSPNTPQPPPCRRALLHSL